MLVGLQASPVLAQPIVGATPETVRAEPDKDPSERLQEAILAFERGDLGAAADGFHDVLDYPVEVRTRQELHDGFLHYAFTLFLQNSKKQAAEKLGIALRLDPDYQPSPVVLRPDLYTFYQDQRSAFLARFPAGAPEPEAPVQIFPTLQAKAGVVEGGLPFVPIFGIGLYKLGHRDDAIGFAIPEVSAIAFNAASIVMRLVAYDKRTPAGDLLYDVSVTINVASFAVFWPVFIAEVILTLTRQKTYTDHPELRPRIALGPGRAASRPPVLTFGAQGLSLAFW
jgi:hypothetical protein